MLSDEERLAAAALNLRHVEDVCVPVVLNIIGHYLSAHLKKKKHIYQINLTHTAVGVK